LRDPIISLDSSAAFREASWPSRVPGPKEYSEILNPRGQLHDVDFSAAPIAAYYENCRRRLQRMPGDQRLWSYLTQLKFAGMPENERKARFHGLTTNRKPRRSVAK
jgi:hypothetical protein